jgi:plastocyanin
MSMRFVGLAAAVAVALAAGSACGGGGGSPSTPSPSPSTGGTPISISIVGERGRQSFNPNPASAAGEMVVFRNTDSVVHRVLLNDGTIDTGDIPPGGTSRAVRMPAAGTNYHCSLHPTMIGAVNADNQAPPPCTGLYC